jgi:hypothetical protein
MKSWRNTSQRLIGFLLAAALGAAWGAPAALAATGSGKPKPGPASAGPPADGTALAEVDGDRVTVGDLRERMRELDAKHSRVMVGEKEATQILFRNLINDRLAVRYMKARGKTDSAEFRDRSAALRTIVLGNAYHQELVRNYVPTDEEVRRYFPAYLKVVDFRVFFGATFGEATKARQEVEAGADMAQIVRDRSIGPGKESGGLVREQRAGGIMLPPWLDKELFEQSPGWISPVWENELGYNFVRLENARDFGPEEVSSMSDAARREAVRAASVRFTEEALEGRRVERNEALLKELDSLPSEKWKGKYPETVARVDGKPVSVREFYWYLRVGLSGKFPAPGTGEIPPLLDSLLKYRVMAAKAEAEGMDRRPDLKKIMDRDVNKALLEMFREEVEGSVKVGDREVREYFDRNRGRFLRPEGREIVMVRADDEAAARRVLDAGKSDPKGFGNAAKAMASSTRTIKAPDKPETIYRGTLGDLSVENPVFGAREGEILGPFPVAGKWYVVQVVRKIAPEEGKKFQDYEPRAREALLKERREEALRKKKEELYRKASVHTYTEVLNRVEWPEDGGKVPAGHGGTGGK